MPFQAETVWVPTIPSFKGFGAAMDKGTTGAAASAGVKAGASFSKSFAAGAGKDRSFEAVEKRIADTVSASSKRMAAARTAEEDATRKARTEEQKLQELRESGKAKASQLSTAEDRLVRAQRALRNAQDQTRKSTQDYDDALERGTRELKDAHSEATRSVSAFDRLGRAVSGVKGGLNFSGVGNVAKAGLRGVATGAGAVVVGLTAAGAAGVAYGVKVASGNEQAEISFTTMLGSAQKASSFLKDLQQFAATTPFEFPELQTAASSLISAGIEADKVIPIMRTLGDVTSGMGTGSEGVQRATVALQQMSAAGRITGEDLNQLRDAGVPVFDLLAAATGKSKAEIVKLAQAGKLGKDELGQLMKALEDGKGLERFSGLMDKQSQSLQGLASTLKDTLGQGLADAVRPSFPVIKQGFKEINAGAGAFFGYLDDHREDITAIVGAGGAALKSFSRIAKGAFGGASDSLTGGTSALTSFADYVSSHQADITSFFVGAGHAAIGFGKGLAQVAYGALRAFQGLNQGVNAALVAIIEGAADTARLLGNNDLAAKLDGMAEHARTKAAAMDASLGGAADGIKNKLIPALDAADAGLTKVGNAEIAKAALRDQAAMAALAIKGIGTEADGSQIKLKKFADISKLSADQQAGLKGRINDARTALNQQLGAIQAAGGGQKQLTAAWKEGKDRLYDEFRQMGLSKKAAQDLAAKYAGIKPKVKTEVTQPGMKDARKNTQGFKKDIANLPNKKNIDIKVQFDVIAKGIDIGIAAAADFFGTKKGKARGGIIEGKARGGILPGNTPLSRGDDIAFPMQSGAIQPLRGGEGITVTEALRDPYERRRLMTMNQRVLSGASPSSVRQSMGEGLATGGFVDSRIQALAELGPIPNVASTLTKSAGAVTDLAAAIGKRAAQEAQKKYAESGGNTGAALAFAKAHKGHPYQYGTIWDCSGIVGAMHSIAKGEDPHRRYATPAFHGDKAQGFTRGKQSNFMIAVNPNPGKSGHMVARVNGVGVEEAGGVGLRVGASARSLSNGMFSWRGGLAQGGIVGDLPYDLLNPRGERYDPKLRRVVEQTSLRTALFDQGGYLQPGLTLAYNGTGKPERIRTEVQERSVRQATGTTRNVTLNAYGSDPRQTARELHELERIDDVMSQFQGRG